MFHGRCQGGAAVVYKVKQHCSCRQAVVGGINLYFKGVQKLQLQQWHDDVKFFYIFIYKFYIYVCVCMYVCVYVFSLSWERVLVLIICASITAVLEYDLIYLLFVQFLGGRDTVKLSVERGKLMGEPCA